MSAPCLALHVFAFWVSWSLKLKVLLTYFIWMLERSADSCLPRYREESEAMSVEDSFSHFLLDLHFQLCSRERAGGGTSPALWVTMAAEMPYGHQVNDCSEAGEGLGAALYPRWLCGEEAGREGFVAAVTSTSSLPLPASHVLMTSLPFCRNLWSQNPCRWQE